VFSTLALSKKLDEELLKKRAPAPEVTKKHERITLGEPSLEIWSSL
jgi:low affinity Fe/Cu permease